MTNTQAEESNLVHRARLSERYHDRDTHPWLPMVVGAGLVIAVVLYFVIFN